MRWESNVLCDGETRVIKAFLWLPVSIVAGTKVETRWLETVGLRQIYHSAANIDGESYWQNIAFVDKKEAAKA